MYADFDLPRSLCKYFDDATTLGPRSSARRVSWRLGVRSLARSPPPPDARASRSRCLRAYLLPRPPPCALAHTQTHPRPPTQHTRTTATTRRKASADTQQQQAPTSSSPTLSLSLLPATMHGGQDWDPVIIRKKPASQAAAKDEASVNAVRRRCGGRARERIALTLFGRRPSLRAAARARRSTRAAGARSLNPRACSTAAAACTRRAVGARWSLPSRAARASSVAHARAAHSHTTPAQHTRPRTSKNKPQARRTGAAVETSKKCECFSRRFSQARQETARARRQGRLFLLPDRTTPDGLRP